MSCPWNLDVLTKSTQMDASVFSILVAHAANLNLIRRVPLTSEQHQTPTEVFLTEFQYREQISNLQPTG